MSFYYTDNHYSLIHKVFLRKEAAVTIVYGKCMCVDKKSFDGSQEYDRLNVSCAYELGATFLAVAQLPFCVCVCRGWGVLRFFHLSFPLTLVWCKHSIIGVEVTSFAWLQLIRCNRNSSWCSTLVDKSMIFCYCHLVETREEFHHSISDQM